MENDTDTICDVYLTRNQRAAYDRQRRDAERYRKLREHSSLIGSVRGNGIGLTCGNWVKDEGDKQKLDAAVDAMNGANGLS
jgi:hypothetical protein